MSGISTYKGACGKQYAAGLVANGPVGWIMLGGAAAGGAALGSYVGTKD